MLYNALIVGAVRGTFYSSHVYAIDSAGHEIRADLHVDHSVSYAEWSRDHQWVVVATGAPGKSEIVIMDVAGHVRAKLTDYRNGESFDPAWAPDGGHIAYFSYDAVGDRDGIYTADMTCLDENAQCQPPSRFLAQGYSPSWSPDGMRIVFESFDGKIQVLSVNRAADLTTVLANETCRDPDWSPAEDRIALSCFTNGTQDIFLVNPDGADFQNLTNGVGSSKMPIWSPDGTMIAFVSDRDTGGDMLGFDDTVRANSVYTMNSDGLNVRRLTWRDDESVQWLTWVFP